jgi:hypothetical protein
MKGVPKKVTPVQLEVHIYYEILQWADITTGMRHIMTFQSLMDRIRQWSHKIMIL